ncbi:phosphoribosyltransferase family protein [Campylobacter hominis]|uniref:Phosphoribosyltransferase domain-containing protein n=1 Tax=Campylobacter hominis (strain ATCC BAA-381 / DSM 21671 / CCUG 45161 / LMG 19568 / NCTC 13146 / CH001A) TaxID=360107 RepID=A7I001_CAMHC|nr:phosphoribosyltransferase family protein [Campylobacter hominis]ABS52094.1 conserved hypothetical protein [Campylobacter hominis ATCC BAA-381]UAK85301.1 sodium:proton antiporter [Campylobacter hominis]SUW84395.1 Na+/H+ antiporter [Campylobacter hominis]
MIEREKLMFENQLDASTQLLEILPKFDNALLVCISLESVILVDNIARNLKLGYEILFTDTIYAPNNAECAIACVSETEEIVVVNELIDAFGINLDFIYGESKRKYEETILKNIYKFRKGKLLEKLKNKNIILIDDGCDSEITALTCIKSLTHLGAKTITYATPLIASDVKQNLGFLVDEIYAVHSISNFVDVDFYYKDKIEPKSDIIMSILEESPYYLPLKKEGEKV